MDQNRLIEIIDALQLAFLEGRFDDVQKHFQLPLVIYSVAGVTLARDRAEFSRLVQQFRMAMEALDVASSTFEVTEFGISENGRTRATVSFSDFNSEGVQVTGSVVRYFFVEADGTFKIEMMEYLQEPLSPSVIEQIVH